MASAGKLDIPCLLNSPILPSKVLILLAATCLGWIGLLTLAFVSWIGTNVTAGWIFAGILFLALVVWIVVMAGEFRSAMEAPRLHMEDGDSDDHGEVTYPLPRAATLARMGLDRMTWRGRRFLPVSNRVIPRRISRGERPVIR